MTKETVIKQAFEIAAERYAAVGVDVNKAMEQLGKLSLSLHCWQADDVTGFENQGGSLTGGIQVTGNYPGRARTIEELRQDILKAKSFIPGTHRLSLHETYGDFQGERVDRNEAAPFCLLDGMGQGAQHEVGLQQHLLLSPEEWQPDPRKPR